MYINIQKANNDAECSKEIKARLGKGKNVSADLKSHGIAVATNVRLMRVLL